VCPSIDNIDQTLSVLKATTPEFRQTASAILVWLRSKVNGGARLTKRISSHYAPHVRPSAFELAGAVALPGDHVHTKHRPISRTASKRDQRTVTRSLYWKWPHQITRPQVRNHATLKCVRCFLWIACMGRMSYSRQAVRLASVTRKYRFFTACPYLSESTTNVSHVCRKSVD